MLEITAITPDGVRYPYADGSSKHMPAYNDVDSLRRDLQAQVRHESRFSNGNGFELVEKRSGSALVFKLVKGNRVIHTYEVRNGNPQHGFF